MHAGVLTTVGKKITLPWFWHGCQNNKWRTVFDFLSGSLHLVVSLSCSKACELLECITEDWSHGIYCERTNSYNFGGTKHKVSSN